LQAFQHFPGFEDGCAGRADPSFRVLNASAHLEYVHKDAVQHVVDIIQYDGRDAQFLNALTPSHRLAFHDANTEHRFAHKLSGHMVA
jgi:hypothetical protein